MDQGLNCRYFSNYTRAYGKGYFRLQAIYTKIKDQFI